MRTRKTPPAASFHGFSGYADYEKFILGLPDAADIPVEITKLGESVSGRGIYSARLGAADPAQPGILYSALSHGHEFAAGDMCLAILRWFTDPLNRAAAAPILERCPVYFLPVVNPDSNERAYRDLRGTGISFARKNDNGVDLNRNFPSHFKTGPMSPVMASNLPFMLVYRGRHPLSEPETRAFKRLVDGARLRVSLSIHSPGRFIGYPWCHTIKPCPNRDEMHRIAENMRSLQPFFKYRIGCEYTYLPTSGDLDDWLYEEYGIFAFLLEVGRLGLVLNDPKTWLNMYAWCNAPGIEIEIENNIAAAVFPARWVAGLESI